MEKEWKEGNVVEMGWVWVKKFASERVVREKQRRGSSTGRIAGDGVAGV